MSITAAEHHEILKNGTKGEQRNALNSMVDDFLNDGGVIQKISNDGKSSTYWERDLDTGIMEKVL